MGFTQSINFEFVKPDQKESSDHIYNGHNESTMKDEFREALSDYHAGARMPDRTPKALMKNRNISNPYLWL